MRVPVEQKTVANAVHPVLQHPLVWEERLAFPLPKLPLLLLLLLVLLLLILLPILLMLYVGSQ